MSDLSQLRQSAAVAFEKLAQQAGLEPQNYVLGKEWIKDDSNRLHIVQRYDAAVGSVVLKLAMRPKDTAAFEGILGAHVLAQSALADHPTATVPRVLAQDISMQAYLMAHFEGETFLELCRQSDNHIAYLEAVGVWLSAYHGATHSEDRPFQPKFMVGHMNHLVEKMQRGERKIKAQNKFMKHVEELPDFAGDAKGHVGKVSAKHGDLNAHNLLIGQGKTVALDFLANGHAPVAYDISRFLLSYVQMVGDLSAIPKGQVVPEDALRAFFKGYQFVEPTDPTVHFMLRVQILTDWNRMQHKSTLGSLIRFKRVKEIARQAFA